MLLDKEWDERKILYWLDIEIGMKFSFGDVDWMLNMSSSCSIVILSCKYLKRWRYFG